MEFQNLIYAKAIKRYKRFMVDVELENGEVITVHCPNSGRMTTCLEPGATVAISDSGNPKRKYRHTLELVKMPTSWICVNTNMANRVGKEIVLSEKIPQLAGYDKIRTEVTYPGESRSRVDLCLEKGDEQCFVEIKSCTLAKGNGVGSFPDAPTERGRKHLVELAELIEQGIRPVILFVTMREDIDTVQAEREIDPEFADLLTEVNRKGVEVLACRLKVSPDGLIFDRMLPVVL